VKRNANTALLLSMPDGRLRVACFLLMAVLAGDRLFDAFAGLSVVLVLVAIPFTEIRRRKLGPVLVHLPRVPSPCE
jgi:hypothetical protein